MTGLPSEVSVGHPAGPGGTLLDHDTPRVSESPARPGVSSKRQRLILPHFAGRRRGLPGGSPVRYAATVEPSVETTPAIQDYLGALYDLTGGDMPVIGARLARHMHVSAPSITEALRRMQREGYIRLAGRKEIRLTTKGRGIAHTMAPPHRLLERWLADVLGLDWSRAHDEAHRLGQI